MAKLVVEDTSLISVANKIRERTETPDKLVFPEGFNSAIDTIKGGAENQELNITSNGTYTAPEGVGYSPVKVNVPQDGAPTAEELTITGDCDYRFANGGWDWVIKKYGNQMTTKKITGGSSMFSWCNVPKIPFELNYDTGPYVAKAGLDRMFSYCGLTEFPIFHNCKIDNITKMFANAQYVSYFPKDFEKGFDFSWVDSQTSAYSAMAQEVFTGMYRLRKLPIEFMKHGNPCLDSGYCFYNFGNNYCLDDITDLPNPYYKVQWTSNAFGSWGPNKCFEYCEHLKDLTFAPTMTNGEPNNPKWSNQTIALTAQVGYGNLDRYGLPVEKEIKDDATYQQFKDDPDAWTKLQEYSRYNHDSAVRTINSLPDTSAFIASNGGTNTIKFNGANGSKTDGGAINTLTEAEIAVAAAKGWTVTLV